jgi:hypothetical protein
MATQREAMEALFTAIATAAEQVNGSGLNAASKARAIADIAVAYRYVSGGAQPGSVSVEK